MAISIRLSRGGSKKRPYYRIVVADARSPRDGKFIEKLGTYNPLLSKDDDRRITLDSDRARHWLAVGAQPTDRVARFLDAAGVSERAKRDNPSKGVPGEKAQERAAQRAERLEASATAALDPAGSYAISIGLGIEDHDALAKLEAGARNFMRFMGYSVETELASAE